MGQIMMLKRKCVCGEWDRVALIKGKTAKVPFWYVKCPRCGRETAKHTGPEEAVREWNHMEDWNDGSMLQL